MCPCIVFADEGDILKDSPNPDLKYNQVIRPWKSRLGLFYTKHQTVWVDIQIIFLSVFSAISRPKALQRLQRLLVKLGANRQLIEVAGRHLLLKPLPPPGASKLETRF